MSTEDGELQPKRRQQHHQRDEHDQENFLALWRWIAIGTATILIIFTVVIDSLGRLYVDHDFHVSEILFGALISAWLVLLGFEGKSIIDRVRGGNGK